MTTTPGVTQLLLMNGALRQEGHFILASGHHSNSYYHVRLALADDTCAADIASLLVNQIREKMLNPTVIVSWTIGGLLLALALEKHFLLGGAAQQTELLHLDPVTQELNLRPGAESVLLVDDVLTTGRTLTSLVRKVQASEPQDWGVGVVAQTTPLSDQLAVKLQLVGDSVEFHGDDVSLTDAIERRITILTELPLEYVTGVQSPSIDLRDANTNPMTVMRSLPTAAREHFAVAIGRILERDTIVVRAPELQKQITDALRFSQEAAW